MERLPKEVTDFVVNLVFERGHFAYLGIDAEGRLLRWGGALETFGIDRLREGISVVLQVPFLNGVLPIEEQSLCVPLLRVDSQTCVYVHLQRREPMDWILLEDKTVEASNLLRQLAAVMQ